MKRCLTLFAALLLLLCSCSGGEQSAKPKTADMLNITNTEKNFLGCKSRFEAVISAMKAKASVLENEHNSAVKAENKSEYFLEDNYILTVFHPFELDSFSLTDGFSDEMTPENAKSYYELQGNGADVVYDSDGKSSFSLMFVSEEITKKYTVDYDEKQDSFRYAFTVEDSEGEHTEEFLEFSKAENGVYVIQSTDTRCYIQFDSEDKITYFCCGELNGGDFIEDDSIYPSPAENVDGYWVLTKGKASFLNIHTYENGILTHEDCSSGPWKNIKINEADYASAFLKNS